MYASAKISKKAEVNFKLENKAPKGYLEVPKLAREDSHELYW
jgi:hypothetical protein